MTTANAEPKEGGITVIIPNRNHGRFLPAAVEAVCTQSRAPDRVVVVDDESTDDSLAVAEALGRRWPIDIRRNPRNKGTVATMNEQLEQTDTEYVFFAAADDVVLPGLFKATAGMLDDYPAAAFCTTRTRVVELDGADVPSPPPFTFPRSGFVAPRRALELLMRFGGFAAGNTTLHRTGLLRGRGGFSREFGAFSDGYVYQVQALAHGCCFVDEELGVWQRSDGGLAGRLARDPDGMMEMLKTIQARMRGSDRAFFPETYIRRFAARWRYAAALGALSIGDRPEILSRLDLSAADRLLLSLLGHRNQARYLFVRMLPADALTVLSKKWQGR